MNEKILIIGAGATGLMAAHILTKAGKQVVVLEARERLGGRIHTINTQASLMPAELGAEFIHGDLPVTLGLLKEAGISLLSADAEMWLYENGRFSNEGFFTEDWGLLMEKLGKLKIDTDIYSFLEKEFPGNKYRSLREAVWKFVSGYDTADPRQASAFSLRTEWENEDSGDQHRIEGGYGALINYLEQEIKKAGGIVYLNSIVKEIHWQPGKVKVITSEGITYEAEKLLIALPLGVLQADKNEKAAVVFSPPITEQNDAIKSMGFGSVIKILLEFDDLFWTDEIAEKRAGGSLKNMGFLLSDEEIPTWWSQAPQNSPVLTGWIGGPAASDKKDSSDDEILEQSLQSLANIFNREVEDLKNKLVSFYIVNWTTEPFTLGSYAYDTVEAPTSRKVLNYPVDNTLFFAGEYLYEGPAMGTVEAALISGKEAAEKIIKVEKIV